MPPVNKHGMVEALCRASLQSQWPCGCWDGTSMERAIGCRSGIAAFGGHV